MSDNDRLRAERIREALRALHSEIVAARADGIEVVLKDLHHIGTPTWPGYLDVVTIKRPL